MDAEKLDEDSYNFSWRYIFCEDTYYDGFLMLEDKSNI